MVINYETGKEQNVFPVHMSSILLGAVVGTGGHWFTMAVCKVMLHTILKADRVNQWVHGQDTFFFIGFLFPCFTMAECKLMLHTISKADRVNQHPWVYGKDTFFFIGFLFPN